MDIAPLKLQIRRPKRDAARRHTTEINFDQLRGRAISELEKDAITSLSTENLSGESYDDTNKEKVSGEEPYLNSSWSNVYNGMGGLDTPESDSSSYYVGSQEDILKELNEVPTNNHLNVGSRHQYQLSYELALDNMLTPFTSHAPIVSPLATAALSKPKTHSYNPKHVIDEMVTTEESYITDLSDIIDGYLAPFERKVALLPLEQQDIDDLFGNILEIRDFHKNLLRLLFEGGHNPGKIAACFLQEAEGFKIYTQYCNNYPRSVHIFKTFCKDPDISPFLKSCQLRLHHMLPLDAFLLKPVQRVLKYSLLLYEMGKRTRRESENYGVVQRALEKMTDVAQHINSMKKKYEMTVHIEEVQQLIRGEWTGLNLSKYGDIVLEENMRYAHYSGKNARFRTERYVFLFQKLCLITKREEDGYYYYKAHIEMADLQLTEKVDKLPRCFQLRQVSTGKYHTFMTANPRSKDAWVRNIKLLLVESIPHLPDKARQLIMQGFDITPDHSPKRERHVRHHSEEPQRFQIHTSSHPSGRSSLDSTNKSLTFRRFSAEVTDKKSKQKMRSSTAPSSGPGSLKSLMASPLHNFHPMVEENEASLQNVEELNQTVGDKRDNGFLETSSSNQNGDLGRHPQAADTSPAQSDAAQRRSPKIRIPQLSHSSSSSPQIGMATISEHNNSPNLRRAEVLSKLDVSEEELDEYENAHKIGMQDVQKAGDRLRSERVSLPNIENHSQLPDMANVIIPPPKLYLNTPPPSVEIEIESDMMQAATSETSLKFTEDQENFFDELMSSSSTLSEMFHKELETDDENARTVFLEQSHEARVDHEDRLPFYVFHHDNEVEDDNVTPQASPCPSPISSIRRWSVSRNSNPRQTDEDMLPTPTASPFVRRPLSSSSSCTSSPSTDNASSTAIDPPTPFRHLSPEPYSNIVQTSLGTASAMDAPKGKQSIYRRHSFSSDTKKNTIHHRQESRSMEASPQSTPKVTRSDRTANESLPVANDTIQSDFNHTTVQAPHVLRDIPTINIESCSESDLTPIQNPDNVILPPPIEFLDQKNHLAHDNSHSYSPTSPIKSPGICTYEDDRNHDSHATNGLEKDQETVTTPYESNPNEMLLFTEVLATFDDYASTTGKTTKSTKPIVKLRSRSPEAKRRKEKKKKRSQTISMIDADTMNQVREELARRSDDKPSDSLRPSEQKSDSKVHKMAREYSRKIKDHQRGGIFKRFSTVVEEPLPSKGMSQPEWLQQLKKRSTEPKPTSPELEVSKDSSQTVPPEVAALTGSLKRTKSRVKDYSDYEDQQRKGGLKGWVRSLVDKISTSGYVKEK